MKTIVLPNYNKNIIRALLGLKVEEREITKPGSDEVTIKMFAAPVNPSDIAFMQGGYNIIKPLPAVMGFEGAGEVVDAGENARELIGKKVSCFVQNETGGTWSEYLTTNKNNIILLNDDMDMEQASCFTVNPFTAYALLEEVTCKEGDALIITAAGGQVPGFLRSLLKQKGITSVNIVRKEKTAEKLKKAGNEFVFLESDEDLTEKLSELNKKLKICDAVDAVGGQLTGEIFNSLPENKKLVLYGGLSNQPVCGLDSLRIIFSKNFITGFDLPRWFEKKKGTSEFEEISKFLQQQFIEGNMKTEINNVIRAEDVVKGIRDYISDMSGGKVLIKF